MLPCGVYRIFILSPAQSGGKRAQFLFNPKAGFSLARRLQAGEPVPLGEIFSFLSGLYFRGKLAYARAFANPPPGIPGILVITPHRGLLPVDTAVTLDEFRRFGRVQIDEAEPRYRRPLVRDARVLGKALGPGPWETVLLGSVATGKYVNVFLKHWGDRLRFPAAFIGRGDMSRGGLMLRCAAGKSELEYMPALGALRHGTRPPKLTAETRVSLAESWKLCQVPAAVTIKDRPTLRAKGDPS